MKVKFIRESLYYYRYTAEVYEPEEPNNLMGFDDD